MAQSLPGPGASWTPPSADALGCSHGAKTSGKGRARISAGLLTVAGLGVGFGLCCAPSLESQRASLLAAVAAIFGGPQGDRWRRAGGGALPFAAASLGGLQSPAAETAPSEAYRDPSTGIVFPKGLDGDEERRLAGVGVRKKSIFGPAAIKVYAYGVYVDPQSLRDVLGGKYGATPAESLAASKYFASDAVAQDTLLTVRLVIHYKGLKIGQIRSAFEDSIGGRIKAFNQGQPNTALLRSFTKLFKDDVTLQAGTVIEISRTLGQVLRTKIDGKDIGNVKSALLCKSFFDLYIGDDSFDGQAQGKVRSNFAKIVSSG